MQPTPDKVQIMGDPARQLLIEEGQDYIIGEETELPFDVDEELGSGLSAVVQKVRDRRNQRVFAKKTTIFTGLRLRAQHEEEFKNEVKIIRSLKDNRHIIRIFATYVAKREFCMLLEPVANANLTQFLVNYKRMSNRATSPESKTLKQSFGCLASGLAYIHRKGIRHRDIKPGNILVYGEEVIYTDFGASKVFNVASSTTTEGPPDFLTPRYAAPEVLDYDKRNYAADVFSLGCVFMEIFSALTDRTYDATQSFSTQIEQIHEDLESAPVSSQLSSLPNTITSMMRQEMRKRATASQSSSIICANADLCCNVCRGLHIAKIPSTENVLSSWTWAPTRGRFYRYVYQGGIVVETKWCDSLSETEGEWSATINAACFHLNCKVMLT